MATKLWYGLEHIPKSNNELGKFLSALEKLVADDRVYLYFDPDYDYKSGSAKLQIKITNDDVLKNIVNASVFKKYSFKKTGENYSSSSDINVQLYKSGGIRGTGKLPRYGESQKNPSTEEQERGTIAYFERMMRGKKPTLLEISEDVGYAFDDSWMWNFEQQYIAFKQEFGNLSGTLYLDSGTNDSNVLLQIAKRVGLKDQKDNWNPADIWLMNTSKSNILSETKHITTLDEYNAYLVEKYNEKKIIGISLKKIDTGKKATAKKIVSDDTEVVDLKVSRVIFDPFQKNFILETDGNVKGFNLRVGYKAASITKESDIRIYIEGRQKGTSVQLGAVSAALFPALAKDNGFNIDADKKMIFKDPLSYLSKNMKKIKSKSIVVSKESPMPSSELMVKAGAFLLYYLIIFLESDPSVLKSCYYSASKKNDFSSIHLKIS